MLRLPLWGVYSLLLPKIEGLILDHGLGPERHGINLFTASSTAQLALTTPVNEVEPVGVHSTPATRTLLPRETSTISSKAVIVWDYETTTAFPEWMCGFVDGDPSSWYGCDSWTETCAIAGSVQCCAVDGVCAMTESYSTCQNLLITDTYDPNYYSYSFTSSSTLFCVDTYLQCNIVAYGEVTSTACMDNAWYLTLPQELLADYAGYTLSYDNYWELQAVIGTPTVTASSSSTSSSSINTVTDPVGYLGKFKSSPPQCVNSMTSLCPSLYTAIQRCYNSSDSSNNIRIPCYCNALEENSCQGLCLRGTEPNDYLHWTVPMCEGAFATNSSAFTSNSSHNETYPSPIPIHSNWTSLWSDYQNTSHQAYLELFPWSWNLQLDSTEKLNIGAKAFQNSTSTNESALSCPAVGTKLLTFAVINFIVFCLSVLTANRHFIFWFTCHKFGKAGSKWWPGSAVLSVGLNLMANIINAALIKRTAGFHHVPLWGLVLFWSTRPRLGWMVVVLAFFTVFLEKDMTTYIEAAVAALMAEIILQAFGSIYLGMTVNHARKNGFYKLGHLGDTPHGTDALIMYVGALMWTVFIGGAVLYAIYTFTVVGTIVNSALVWIGDKMKKCALAISRLLRLIFSFIWVLTLGTLYYVLLILASAFWFMLVLLRDIGDWVVVETLSYRTRAHEPDPTPDQTPSRPRWSRFSRHNYLGWPSRVFSNLNKVIIDLFKKMKIKVAEIFRNDEPAGGTESAEKQEKASEGESTNTLYYGENGAGGAAEIGQEKDHPDTDLNYQRGYSKISTDEIPQYAARRQLPRAPLSRRPGRLKSSNIEDMDINQPSYTRLNSQTQPHNSDPDAIDPIDPDLGLKRQSSTSSRFLPHPDDLNPRATLARFLVQMGFESNLLDRLGYLFLAMLMPWIGQWIFWIGFVRLAGDLYCPPDIWTLTAVWSLCSVVAIWFSATF